MSQPLKQLWKHSSSLIILGKNAEAIKPNRFNYKVREFTWISAKQINSVQITSVNWLFFFKVFVMERPAKGSYPGAIVFPGGVTEQADQVDDWLKFYRKFGIDDSKFKSIKKTCPNRSFIFKTDNSDCINRWVNAFTNQLNSSSFMNSKLREIKLQILTFTLVSVIFHYE